MVQGKRMKCAPNERECRALMVSRLRRSSASSNSSRSSGSAVVRLPQPIMGRHKDSQKAGGRDNQKKRQRHGHNNFGAITPAAPELKKSGAAFFVVVFVFTRSDGLGSRRFQRRRPGSVTP